MSVTREQLYEQVWSQPMLAVAQDQAVSGNYLARVCAALNVPWPPRGYWAKVAAGQKPKRPELPPARPGEQLAWTKGVGLDLPPIRPARTAKKPPPDTEPAGSSEPDQPTRHALVTAVREFFDIDRTTQNGYLRPRKRLLVDIVVSRSMLTTALDVANNLFLMLERHGHRVTLAPSHHAWHRPPLELEGHKHDHYSPEPCRPDRPTLVFVKSVAFGLTLYETSAPVELQHIRHDYVPVSELTPADLRWIQRNYTWTTTEHRPTGKLALRAYAGDGWANWQQEWVERKPGELPHRFRTIRRTLVDAVPEIERQIEKARQEADERNRQWEIAAAKRRQEERERREREAYKASREQLLAIADRWALARRIEEFFRDLERRTGDLAEAERLALSTRLHQAREMLGSVDALRHFVTWQSPTDRLRESGPEA